MKNGFNSMKYKTFKKEKNPSYTKFYVDFKYDISYFKILTYIFYKIYIYFFIIYFLYLVLTLCFF